MWFLALGLHRRFVLQRRKGKMQFMLFHHLMRTHRHKYSEPLLCIASLLKQCIIYSLKVSQTPVSRGLLHTWTVKSSNTGLSTENGQKLYSPHSHSAEVATIELLKKIIRTKYNFQHIFLIWLTHFLSLQFHVQRTLSLLSPIYKEYHSWHAIQLV